MSKKSSKTSHVLNLLTNRTGAVIDGEADKEQEQASSSDGGGSSRGGSSPASGGNSSSGNFTGGNSSSGEANGLPNPFLVEIAAPVRIAVSNPIIAELTGENAFRNSSSAFPGETPQKQAEEKPERKNQSVADLIQMELERTYQRDQQPPEASMPQQSQGFTGAQQPQGSSEAQPQETSMPQPKQEAQQAASEVHRVPQDDSQFSEARSQDNAPSGAQQPQEASMPQQSQGLAGAQKPQETSMSQPQGSSEAQPTEAPQAPAKEAPQGSPSEEELIPPHIEEFTLDEFAEPEGSENSDEAAQAGGTTRTATRTAATTSKEAEDMFQPCYINVMDEIVRSNVMPIMESLEMCTCSRCVNDVVALALNLLPPKYVVTQKGSLYAKVSLYEGQHKVDVLSSITKACLEVQNNPRHCQDEMIRMK